MDQYVLAFIAVCAIILVLFIITSVAFAVRGRQKMNGEGGQPMNTDSHYRYTPQNNRAIYMDPPPSDLLEQQTSQQQHHHHHHESGSDSSVHHHPTSTPDVSVHHHSGFDGGHHGGGGHGF